MHALWNQAVTVPSLLLDAASLVSSPASLANQQGVAIRFSLRGLAATVALLGAIIIAAPEPAPRPEDQP